MKKIFVLLFILFIGLQNAAQSVEAHILKTDQNIGAVLHISPQDDPVAREVSYLFFDFKDKTGKFDPNQCDCTVTVYANKKIVHSESLTLDHSNKTASASTFSYIFPEKNIYIVQVSGKPRQINTFQPFVLSYDIRVNTTASQANSEVAKNSNNDHAVHSAIFFIAFAVLIIWHTIGTLRKSGKKKTPTKTLILILIPIYSLMILGHIFHVSHSTATEKQIVNNSCCTIATSEMAQGFTWSIEDSQYVTIRQVSPVALFIVLSKPFHNRSPTFTT